MAAIELAMGNVYIYRGQIFKKDTIYEVADELAQELLGKVSDKGMHHFRMTFLPEGEDAAVPETVAGDAKALPDLAKDEVKVAAVKEEEPIQDEEVTPNVVIRRTPKKKAAPKRTASV